MKTVMEPCTPRRGILQGTFNPEVFTAALGPVMQFYRSGSGAIDSIYTDAETFFREATYPTEGMRQTLSSVFRRIAGDLHLPPGGGEGDGPARFTAGRAVLRRGIAARIPRQRAERYDLRSRPGPSP